MLNLLHTSILSHSRMFSSIVVLLKIRVGCRDRHFDRGALSPEMFIWLYLINPVTVDWKFHSKFGIERIWANYTRIRISGTVSTSFMVSYEIKLI